MFYRVGANQQANKLVTDFTTDVALCWLPLLVYLSFFHVSPSTQTNRFRPLCNTLAPQLSHTTLASLCGLISLATPVALHRLMFRRRPLFRRNNKALHCPG
jgi:hypothetical protein